MAIKKRRESHVDNSESDAASYTYYRYVIKGVMYRAQLVVYSYDDTESPHFFAWVLEQSYHKTCSYRRCGKLIYRGVSLKEAWEEIESYVGPNIEIPENLKQLQPYIAQQT